MALLKDENASSSSKRQKSHGGGGGVSTTDVVGIGRLPDAMLCHILSFLETKHSVQTSVLSKRWRYVWTAVPCIDIHYPRNICFTDFFDRFLRINTVSCLRKFRLTLHQDYKQLSEWINIVMKRDIEEIVLDIGVYEDYFKLPPSLFTCKKLVILKLGYRILSDAPSLVYLPSLKILHLYLGSQDFMTNLLDGCPVIQELNIKGVGDYNEKTLFVRSSSLKSLILHTSYPNDLRIFVDVPNIERLDLMDYWSAPKQYHMRLSERNIIVLERHLEQIALNQCVKLPPPSNFTFKKLESLKLGSGILLDVPPSIYLPSLKILHLCIGKLFDKDSMTNLVDGCPVIEELSIHGMEDCNVKTLFLRSSSLKSLSIHTSSSKNRRIFVDVPNIERLDLLNYRSAQVQYHMRLSERNIIVLERDVEQIALNQCVKLPPPSNFTCKKLESLKLGFGILLDVPPSVYLPSLKILHLCIGKLFDKDSMTNLLDGCPVIEELSIHGMKGCNVKTLFFRSCSLKSLSIHTSSLKNRRIFVDVPNVDQLYLRDHGNTQFDINNLSSLVEVEIYIRQASGLVELLGKFTNTEYMLISFQTMNSLKYQHLDDFPMFHNLTDLVVDIHGPCRLVLPYLLECSPNLVTCNYSVSHKARSCEQHLEFKAPKCLMLYLEEIKLRGLKGFEDEMELVRYFLKNAKVLKELSNSV